MFSENQKTVEYEDDSEAQVMILNGPIVQCTLQWT